MNLLLIYEALIDDILVTDKAELFYYNYALCEVTIKRKQNLKAGNSILFKSWLQPLNKVA